MKSGAHISIAAQSASVVHSPHRPASRTQKGRFGSAQSTSATHSVQVDALVLQCGFGISQSMSDVQVVSGGGGGILGGLGPIGFGADVIARSIEPVSPVVHPTAQASANREMAMTAPRSQRML